MNIYKSISKLYLENIIKFKNGKNKVMDISKFKENSCFYS